MLRTFVAVLLALALPLLTVPVAEARGTLTLRVSDKTIAHGSPVAFSGRLGGAPAGSPIALQRRIGSRWTNTLVGRVGRAASYRFVVSPPRGAQTYRVVAGRHAGRPRMVSRTLDIVVRWRPTLVISDHHDNVDHLGAITTTVTGTAPGLPDGTTLTRETQNDDSTWTPTATTTITNNAWTDTFTATHAQQVRYTTPRLGARQPTTTDPLTIDGTWQPTLRTTYVMDRHTDQLAVAGQSTRLPAGTSVQRQRRVDESWLPDGTPVVVEPGGTFADTFAVTVGAEYRYLVAASGRRLEASSGPIQLREAPAGSIDVDTVSQIVLPAGARSRTFMTTLTKGQQFTLDTDYSLTLTVTGPSGAVLPGYPTSGDHRLTTIAPETGSYGITLGASVISTAPRDFELVLSQPVIVDHALDAPAVDLAAPLRGQVVDLRFAGDAHEVISEYTPSGNGLVTLLDPEGDVVDRWGRTQRRGEVWLLPMDGTYTMRIRPLHYTPVARDDQVLLRAHTVTATVDGGPARVRLDHPGRVAVVQLHANGEPELRLSNTPAGSGIQEELFGPDLQRIETHSTTVDLTGRTGTFRQLVSHDEGPVTIDYYASTPLVYTSSPDSTISYDRGDVPGRRVKVRVPVEADEIFSFEMRNAVGDYCGTPPIPSSGETLLRWATRGGGFPSVYEVATNGELLFEPNACGQSGTFWLIPTSVAPSRVTEVTTTADGYPFVVAEGSIEATRPGQVMLMDYDGGNASWNTVNARVPRTPLPGDTPISVQHVDGVGTWSISRLFNIGTIDGMTRAGSDNVFGHRRIVVWLGSTTTGSLDLRLERTEFRP